MRSTVLHVAIAVLVAASARAQYDSPQFPGLLSPSGMLTARDAAFGDLDGDGRHDVAFVDTYDIEVTIALSHAAGGFLPPATEIAPGQCWAIELGDLDGDTDLDAVVAHSGDAISVLAGDGAGGLPLLSTLVFGGGSPLDVALADMNADGDLDLVAIRITATGLAILNGDGNGGFGFVTNVPVEPTGNPLVRTAELDGNGHPDVVFVDGEGVGIGLGDGAGGLAHVQNVELGAPFTDVAIGDIDGDDQADLLACGWFMGHLSLIPGLGGGEFGDTLEVPLATDHDRVELGDLDHDGDLDAVALAAAPALVNVLPNEGGLVAGDAFAVASSIDQDLALLDPTGDGLLDVLVVGKQIMVLPGDGAGAFDATRANPTPAQGEAVDPGDLDHDGDLDAVSVARFVGVMDVFHNDGAGALQAFAQPKAGTDPNDVVLADVDDDGALDALSPSAFWPRLYVLSGDGQGGFGGFQSWQIPNGSCRSLVVADVDLDGALDAVMAVSLKPQVAVMHGDGAGGFPAATLLDVPLNAWGLDGGDLDGDGVIDLAVGGSGAGSLAVLHGDGTGGFLPAEMVNTTTSSAGHVDIADVSGDGVPDLAATASYALTVISGDGAGGWLPAVVTEEPWSPTELLAVDLDDDDDADLVVAYSSILSVGGELRLATGAGGLGPAIPLALGQSFSFAASDLTGDGRPELLSANGQFATLGVALNSGLSPWTSLGGGVEGIKGVPLLDGSGSLQSGAPLAITLSAAAPLAATTLIVGQATLDAPTKGGVLVPLPLLLLPMASNAAGQWTLASSWPPGVPSGSDFYLQAWLPDAAAAHGWAASDGLRGLVP